MTATGEREGSIVSLGSQRTEVLQEDGGVMVWFSLSTLIGIPEGKLESFGRKESMGKPR